jgi:hypothetical protein
MCEAEEDAVADRLDVLEENLMGMVWSIDAPSVKTSWTTTKHRETYQKHLPEYKTEFERAKMDHEANFVDDTIKRIYQEMRLFDCEPRGKIKVGDKFDAYARMFDEMVKYTKGLGEGFMMPMSSGLRGKHWNELVTDEVFIWDSIGFLGDKVDGQVEVTVDKGKSSTGVTASPGPLKSGFGPAKQSGGGLQAPVMPPGFFGPAKPITPPVAAPPPPALPSFDYSTIYDTIAKVNAPPTPAKEVQAPVGCCCKTAKKCTFEGEHVCCCGALTAGFKDRPGHAVAYCRYKEPKK